jgi:AraC family transcriptional regulator of adaptative response / DNA-3-methyladenine glycosylase II
VSDDASLLDTTKPLDNFVEDLVALKGFGPWTAQYMAMRLGYPDAFPASDLGVRKALNMAPEKDVLKQAEPWRPWRATAVMYLWRSLG